MKLVYILLLLGFVKCVLVYKVYHSIPVLELKRRARQGDKRANDLYKVGAYEATLDVILWVAGVAVGAVLFIWSARTSWELAAAVLVLAAWLVVWAKLPADGWAG